MVSKSLGLYGQEVPDLWTRRTYHRESTDKDIRRSVVVRNHVRDKVCSHADDGDKGDGLEGTDDLERRPQCTESRTGHVDSRRGCKGEGRVGLEEKSENRGPKGKLTKLSQ